MVQIGSFYPGIVFSSLFQIIGRLGFWRWYHLLLSYCFSKIIPFFFTIKEVIFSTSPSLLQGELHFLPKPLFLRKRGCNRPTRSRDRYALRLADHQRSHARLCGMGPPGVGCLQLPILIQINIDIEWSITEMLSPH